MGKKAVEKIERAIKFAEQDTGRLHIGVAMPVALEIAERMRTVKGVEDVTFAGSLRRGKETIGDIDILVCTTDPEGATAAFVGAYVLDSRYGLDQGFEHYDDDVNPLGKSAAAGGYNERPADEVAEANGLAGLSLIVASGNPARRLYARKGYREAARRPIVKEDWVVDSDDWILMTKPTQREPGDTT